jgi:ATP-dependent DNA ligase
VGGAASLKVVIPEAVRLVPVQLYLFDLLHHRGQSLLPVPFPGGGSDCPSSA